MYDNDGVGSPQTPVIPNFNMEESVKMMEEYKGGHDQYPIAHDVVDKFVEQYNKDKGTKYSLREIKGESGTNYGIGVYLDSTLLSNLTEAERIEMVKEYVKELGGKSFTAFDSNDQAVNVHIAKSSQKFRNIKGKQTLVNKDLTRYLKNIKQESIALVDELILTSKYDTQLPANYPHGWLDNYGQNDWEYWTTYIQDKENTIWKATLNIATTTNGEKFLYDIVPIKKVERSLTLDTTTTNISVSQEKPIVNTKIENSQKNLNQDRPSDDESFSNRSILANALESTVQHEVEQKKLDEYRSRIAMLDAEEAKLSKLKAEIKELTYGEKRDPVRLDIIKGVKI